MRRSEVRYPSLTEVASGVAVGAVDLAAHKVDAMQGYSKPFENATDIYRAGLTIGSMLWYGFKGSEIAHVLFDNGLPLLTESVAYAVGKYANVKIPGAPTADPLNVTSGGAVAQQSLQPQAAIRVVNAPAASTLHVV